MKKFMKPFVLVATAAMALASCQKNEISAPEKRDVHFTINAGIETKTLIEENGVDSYGKTLYSAKWGGDEELGVLFAAPNADTGKKDVQRLANTVAGKLASFQGNVTVEQTEGTFYAFYPAAAFDRGYSNGDARLDLKNIQKPIATSFDPTCDILVAEPYDYVVKQDAVVADGLKFARMMSVLRINLKSEYADVQNEFVESVAFTAGDVKITGYARISLDNPKFSEWASTGTQWCTVTANYDSEIVSINGESKSVYLVIAPVTIPAGKDLTFAIKTENYNISKTVKSPEMNFTAGNVSEINLTILEENCEKIDQSVDYSGEYLIIGDKGGTKYAAVKYDGTSDNLKGIALAMEGDKILEFDGMADSRMVVTKVAGGDYDGLYTIQDAAGKYLYAASSSANHLKSADAINESNPQHYYWSIVEKDGAYEIVASRSGNRNVMQFYSSSSLFSCYSSASQKPVSLYPYSDLKPDTTPKISVADTDYSVPATDTSVEIPYTVKNITGAITATVADGATMSNVEATVSDGKVNVTFAANEEPTEKTAIIVLSYEGAESVNVTITQAAAEQGGGSEGGDQPGTVVDVLTADLFAATNTTYKDFDNVTVTSDAIYKGNSSKKSNGAIQLRSTNSGGIVTTSSGGRVTKVVVVWDSSTDDARELDVYGKNTAYTAASDLYNTTDQGTKIGTIAKSSGTSLEIEGDYEYIGLRSKSNTMYLTQIAITWETESGSDSGETPEQPTLSPRNLAFSSATATATVGEAFTEPTLSGEKIDDVEYSSSNTSIATVNASTGAVTLVGAGTTTITATAPETAEYEAGTVTYELTVSEAPSTGATKTFTVKSSDVVSNNSYAEYTKTIDERTWVITCGGYNKSVGANSTNRSKCTLANYPKYAVSPITTSSTASAFASTTKLDNVSKISYAALSGGSNHGNTTIYILYSQDGTSFSQITLTSGTQGATINTSAGGTFEFAKCSGYFAVVFVATNTSGNWRLDDVNLTFTYTD